MSTGLRDPNVLLHSFNNLLVTAAKSCMEFVPRKNPPKWKVKGKE